MRVHNLRRIYPQLVYEIFSLRMWAILTRTFRGHLFFRKPLVSCSSDCEPKQERRTRKKRAPGSGKIQDASRAKDSAKAPVKRTSQKRKAEKKPPPPKDSRERVPWNRGKTLPEPLREKIKARTIAAHRRPDVVLRVLRRDQRPEAEPLPNVQIVGKQGRLEFSLQELKSLDWNWVAAVEQFAAIPPDKSASAEGELPTRSGTGLENRRRRPPSTRPPPEIFQFEPLQMTPQVLRRMSYDVERKLSDSSYLDAYEGKALPKKTLGPNARI